MMPYTLHAGLLVAFGYFLYKFLLERESFYQINRWLLIGLMLLAFLAPFLEIQPGWSWQNSPLADHQPTLFAENSWEEMAPTSLPSEPEEAVAWEPANEFFEGVEKPEEKMETVLPSLEGKRFETLSATTRFKLTNSFALWLRYAYLAGFLFFTLRWLLQISSLFSQIIKHPTIRKGRYRIVHLSKNIAPCSFLNYIFINPDQYDSDTFRQILEHEKIHARQGHSLDMMLAELLVVVQWFNPTAWMFRKAVINNLEFLTDKTMLSKGTDRQSYQLNLLKVAAPQYASFLVSNYNHSILKKRISMMNSHSSSLIASWKYIAVAFMIMGSIMALDAVKKALAKDKWEAEIEGRVVNLSFQPADWSDGWLYQGDADISELTGFTAQQIGQFKLEREAGTILFTGSVQRRQGHGEFVFQANEIFRNHLQEQDLGYPSDETMFRLAIANIREEYIHFLQQFGYEDVALFQLHELAAQQIRLSYLETVLPALQLVAIDQMPLDLLIEISRQGADENLKNIITTLTNTGYQEFSGSQIAELCFQGMDRELARILNALNQEEFQNFTPDQIMIMGTQGVDEELANILQALEDAGFHNFTPDQIMDIGAQGGGEELANIVRVLDETGFRNFTPDQIMHMSIQGIDEELANIVRALDETGFHNFTPDQIMHMSIQGIDEELANIVRALDETGYRNFTPDQIMNISVQSVDEELENIVRVLDETGFRNFTPDQIMNMSVQQVDEELETIVRALQKTGFRNFTPDQIMNMSVQQVDRELETIVEILKETGYQGFSPDQIMTLCLKGMDEQLEKLVKVLKVAGNSALSTDQVLQLTEMMGNW